MNFYEQVGHIRMIDKTHLRIDLELTMWDGSRNIEKHQRPKTLF